MFISEARLPQLLSPTCYFDAEYYARERVLLSESWHVVGSTRQFSRSGDFLTCEIAGVAVHVRNFDGRLVALSNVCAHRHCLISSLASGNSPRMKCQYHGWEYLFDGKTGKIPQPKNFAPFDRNQLCLPHYALETLGQLVFVNVAPAPRPISEFLGTEMFDLIAERFGNSWTEALDWRPTYPVNWKVPVENSLEAYHVPAVHAATFKDDPGNDRSEHVLKPNRTAFGTSLPFAPHSRAQALFQALEGRFVAWMGHAVTNRYWQHHVFPNLLFSFTDAISLVNCVIPIAPTRCRAVVLQFGVLPVRKVVWKSMFARFWSRIEASIIKRILVEDMHIYEAIQRGLETSPHTGILGRCEERIHALQAFIDSRLQTVQIAPSDVPRTALAWPTDQRGTTS